MADVKVKVVGEDKASKELAKVDKALDGMAKASGKTRLSLTDLKSGLDMVLMGLNTFGRAVKQAYDMAKQGAQLEYAAVKFDRLAASIGTTSDALMNDLKQATRGMVSDSELMSGTVDLMALGLAKTHDEAVRLARVVGGLGMNMNQLVLTLTNQTTMRFDALGVSVDGFDAKVKRLEATGMSASDAFKEAFLQQAEEQLTRVGEQADSAVAPFQQLEVEIANVGDEMKKSSAEMLVASGALEEMATAVKGVLAVVSDPAFNAFLKIILDINKFFTPSGAARIGTDWAKGAKEVVEVAKQGAPAIAYLSDGAREAGVQFDRMAKAQAAAATYTGIHRHEVDNAQATMWDYRAAVEQTNEALEAEAEAARRAATSVAGLIDQTNREVGSAISDMIEDLDWLQAGGGEIEAKFAAVVEAIKSGKITPEEGRPMLEGLFTAATELQLELNQIDADEAASRIEDTLNTTLEEAKSIVAELMAPGQSVVYDVLIRYTEQGKPEFITGLPRTGDGKTNRGGSGNPGVEAEYAMGGNFVVPPGYPNDSYRVGLTSGEQVSIARPGQGMGGDTYLDIGGIYILPPSGDPHAIAAAVVTRLGSMQQQAARAGSAYAGR